jgi:hypothetical protein
LPTVAATVTVVSGRTPAARSLGVVRRTAGVASGVGVVVELDELLACGGVPPSWPEELPGRLEHPVTATSAATDARASRARRRSGWRRASNTGGLHEVG